MKIKIFFLFILLSCLTKTYSQEIDLNVDNINKSALLGCLLSGGSLKGAEVETSLEGRIGIPLCFGFLGACAVLNLPLAPAKTSSYFTVESNAKGVGKIDASPTLGTGIVLRYKRFLVLLGGSYLLGKGPNTIDNWNTHNSITHLVPGVFNPSHNTL